MIRNLHELKIFSRKDQVTIHNKESKTTKNLKNTYIKKKTREKMEWRKKKKKDLKRFSNVWDFCVFTKFLYSHPAKSSGFWKLILKLSNLSDWGNTIFLSNLIPLNESMYKKYRRMEKRKWALEICFWCVFVELFNSDAS